MQKKEYYYLPLNFVIAYICFTLLVFYFGPWKYAEYSIVMLLYMITLMILVVLGYQSGKTDIRLKKKLNDSVISVSNNFILKLITCSLWITLVLNILFFIDSIRDYSLFSLGQMIMRITDLGNVYKNALYMARTDTEVDFIVQLITLTGIFKQIGIIGWLFYRPKSQRVLFVITVALVICNVLLFKGTQKEIFDVGIFYLVTKLATGIRSQSLQQLKKSLKKVVLIILLLGIVFLVIQSSRANAYNYSGKIVSNQFFRLDTDSLLFDIFPVGIAVSIATVLQYISMGYFGLGLCLKLPFSWTYGLGNAAALSSYANQYLGIDDQSLYTYPHRMELVYGYDADMWWHTVVPWLASDFTYVGTLVLFFIIARVYAICWKEVKDKANFLSLILFANLTEFWFFFVGGNVMFLRRENAIASIVLIFWWFWRHRRYNQDMK